jgi:hypothetical protein
MKKLVKKATDGEPKEQIKGSKGTYTATKKGSVMSGVGGRLTSMDTTGYSKGKKNYQVNTNDFYEFPGKVQKVGSTTKTITRKEVIPTINKMKSDIKKKGGTIKTKTKK